MELSEAIQKRVTIRRWKSTPVEKEKIRFKTFVWRITASHTIAYFIAGILAFSIIKYNEIFGVGALAFMLPTSSPMVAAGPGLQIIRGLLLSIILFPFSSIFINTKNGWLKFWLLSFGLSYLFTFSAAVGSFEGIIYTNFPIKYHLLGIPEFITYMTLFTLILWIWYSKNKKWFNFISVIFITLVVLTSIMGALSALG